jgi:hypothetical protein
VQQSLTLLFEAVSLLELSGQKEMKLVMTLGILLGKESFGKL